jgi:hypothetical protein
VQDWPQVVRQDFIKLYAIARRNSKVTAKQFERFCHEIGATLSIAEPGLKALFEPRLIEEVFLVEEYALDAARLAQWAEKALRESGVSVRLRSHARAISQASDHSLSVTTGEVGGVTQHLPCRYVFNCTYSGLNQFQGDFPGIQTGLKHEITEMALMHVPPPLKNIGITVMDGPFFSIMPFPDRGLHTLSHVRYTPHWSWQDQQAIDPYHTLAHYHCTTQANRMVRDTARYLPAVQDATYVDSLFEVKTVLVKNEGDDGRPILFEKTPKLPGCYCVLGGKLDNIYDVLEKLDAEDFNPTLE